MGTAEAALCKEKSSSIYRAYGILPSINSYEILCCKCYLPISLHTVLHHTFTRPTLRYIVPQRVSKTNRRLPNGPWSPLKQFPNQFFSLKISTWAIPTPSNASPWKLSCLQDNLPTRKFRIVKGGNLLGWHFGGRKCSGCLSPTTWYEVIWAKLSMQNCLVMFD